MRVWLLLLAAFGAAGPAECARILGVFPMPAYSHFVLGERLLKGLAARNHQITMVSSFPQKTPVPNFRDVSTEGIAEAVKRELDPSNETTVIFTEMHKQAAWKQALFTQVFGSKVFELTLRSEAVQRLLADGDERFDVVIVELFHSELAYGLAHRFQCPVVVLSTMGSTAWTNALVANPAPSSYVPDLFLNMHGRMSFLQRLHNLLHSLLLALHQNYLYLPKMNKILHSAELFPDSPPLEQLFRERTALVLLNSHPVVSEARPLVPAMVEVGGYHVRPPGQLPADLQAFMDAASHGVVLFSMGSNFKSVYLGNETRDTVLRVFGTLKQRVIWKWEDDELPGCPANVKIMKWCPQSDIMGHKNLKLFITHGGLLSATEAIYHGVPMIGIPIFGDQFMNVAVMAAKGYGLPLYLDSLTEQSLSQTLGQILNDPKYEQNMKRMSRIFHDQPMKPLDRAIFWTEFVARHKGAPHLQTAAIHLDAAQLYMLDIALFLLLISVLLFLLFYYIIKRILGKKAHKQQKEEPKKKLH